MYKKFKFIGHPKAIMGYCLNQILTIKCLWLEEVYFLERKFLAGGSHGKEIELDETQLTNETTQDYEMKTKIH